MMKIILSGIFANLLVTIWSDRETFVAYSREIMKSTKSTAKVGASKDTTKSMDRHGVTTFSRWGVEQPVAGYKDIVASRKMFLSASMDPSSRPPNESHRPSRRCPFFSRLSRAFSLIFRAAKVSSFSADIQFIHSTFFLRNLLF